MAWITQAVGAALGTVGTIASNISGDKLRRSLEAAKGSDPTYSASPYAKNKLGIATGLLNSRGVGASLQERNIFANQGNTAQNISRASTDGGQALQGYLQSQGMTNDALNQQQITEAQDYYNRLNNYNQASDTMTGEHTKLFDDKVRRWQDIINIDMAKHSIRQQQGQNLSNLGGSISSMGGMGGGKGGK